MEAQLKDIFCRYQQHFGTGPGLGPGSGTCLIKIDGVSPVFLKSLYRALAALYRTDPWKRLRPGHLFGLRVGKDSDWVNKRQLFPCVQFIGGDGGDLGLHMFKSEQDALRVSLPVETKPAPNVEILRVVFEKESLLYVSNKRMVASLGLEPSGTDRYPIIDVARGTSNGGGIRFRDPTMEELRYLVAFIKAITLVHPLLQSDTDKETTNSSNVSFEPFIETVDVQWPAEPGTSVVDLVAVTVSYPPNQTYGEKKTMSPIKYIEPPKEEEEYSGSRQCAMCEKPVNWDQSLCCGQCKAIIYCGPICQKNHWREAHKAMCGLYKAMMEREEELAMKIFKFNLVVENSCQWLESMGLHKKGMWRRVCGCYSDYPFGLLPAKSKGAFELWGGLGERDYPADKPFANYMSSNRNPVLLSGWSEYYNIRSLPMSSPVAAILSHPLTVYHILTTVISSKNRLMKGKEVIVHYLGPAAELDWMQAFSEISHLLNGSGTVQIFMVGPEVPSNLLGPVSGLGSRLTVTLVRGLYQEQIMNLPNPHIVIALNCGLESYRSWSGALGVIKSMNVPVFFTERSEVSCTSAKQVLRAGGLHLTHPVGPNPFRSPLREQMPSANLPSFSNGFLFGVNT